MCSTNVQKPAPASLVPQDVQIHHPPLRALKIFLHSRNLDVPQKGLGLDFVVGNLPGRLQPVQHFAACCTRMDALGTGHGVQELQVPQM